MCVKRFLTLLRQIEPTSLDFQLVEFDISLLFERCRSFHIYFVVPDPSTVHNWLCMLHMVATLSKKAHLMLHAVLFSSVVIVRAVALCS